MLVSDYNKDSALRLFQVALDFQEDISLAADAMDALEPILENDEMLSFLRNYVFAIPMEIPTYHEQPPAAWVKFRISFDLLKQVMFGQSYIRAIRVAWDTVAKEHFTTPLSKLQAEKLFVDCGAFFDIFQTVIGRSKRDNLTINLLIAGASVYGCRELTKAWLDALELQKEQKEPYLSVHFQSVLEADRSRYSTESEGDPSAGTDWEKFRRVKAEQAAIVERMKGRDWHNVERFTDRLVSRQIKDGDAEFAAKTLCALAQEAKRLGESSLQLKWSLRATEIFDDDPWSFCKWATH